jgi:hypothetical protein
LRGASALRTSEAALTSSRAARPRLWVDSKLEASGLSETVHFAVSNLDLAGHRMKPFRVVTGVAAPLPLANVDTDMIIRGQSVKAVNRSGLGVGLFHELRYQPDGSPNPDFILNQPAYRRARILVAGPNLGRDLRKSMPRWHSMISAFSV